MKSIINTAIKTVFFLFLIMSTSCQKFLDEKPSKSLVVPTSLEDLQALLNMRLRLNFQNSGLTESLADDYYLTAVSWQAAKETDGKLHYIWDAESQSKETWNTIYQGLIYYSNVVLDALTTIKSTKNNVNQHDIIRGEALFYRSFGFFQLAQLYCQPYSHSANIDLGLPLRTTAAIESPSIRGTVQQTYDQILKDLIIAIDLLPLKVDYPTKPNKVAVYGLLARCYLSMRDYNHAGEYANLCLKENNTLMDYNSISITSAPFRRFNPETIYYSFCSNTPDISLSPNARIDTLLYNSYADFDLRKELFFKEMSGLNIGNYEFKGCYDGDYYPNGIFNGLTTGEMYLIRAECFARAGNTTDALKDLNTLMVNRWKDNGTWIPLKASNDDEALDKILIERRKELVYRGLRWSDLRRFNLEGRNITLERNVNGQKYTLPPGDLRWVLLIPDDAINRSGMKQNPREPN